jgi:hypothetical protein
MELRSSKKEQDPQIKLKMRPYQYTKQFRKRLKMLELRNAGLHGGSLAWCYASVMLLPEKMMICFMVVLRCCMSFIG